MSIAPSSVSVFVSKFFRTNATRRKKTAEDRTVLQEEEAIHIEEYSQKNERESMARQSQMVSHVKWGVRIENTFGKNLTPAGVRFPKKTLFFFWPPPPDVLKVYYSYKVSLTVHVCDWLLRYSDQ